MLPVEGSSSLSLYIHIPFCTTRCSYCAFYSEPRSGWQLLRDRFVSRLLTEIKTLVMAYGRSFDTIFVGGGNPACLGAERLSLLLEAATAFGPCRECTVEMNPETFDRSFFPLLESQAITRLSIGLQSMDDRLLSLLGRNARVRDNRRAIELASEAHRRFCTDLSFDLMTCLPSQTDAMALFDIDEVVRLGDPDHVSLYCLTIEEGTALASAVADRRVVPVDDDGQARLLGLCWEHLASLGYRHYEVSNFCRDGAVSWHNMRYWRLLPYAGLGPSAASTLVAGTDALRFSQGQSLVEYCDAPVFSGYDEQRLDPSEQMEEWLLSGLRIDEGIDKMRFSDRFSRSFDSLFSQVVATFDPRWYVDDRHRFHVTEEGLMVLDSIVLELAMAIPQPLDRRGALW